MKRQGIPGNRYASHYGKKLIKDVNALYMFMSGLPKMGSPFLFFAGIYREGSDEWLTLFVRYDENDEKRYDMSEPEPKE